MKIGYLSTILRRIERAPLTDFQKSVYRVVAAIPSGHTMTYAQVALRIGNPRAVRAVGSALNRNPFAPDVPCHRVIRSDGAVGGFAHGSAAKERLLRLEGVIQ